MIKKALALFFLAVILAGCDKGIDIAGEYEARKHGATLNLMPDHRGEWATQEDNVSFRWEKKNHQVWLHTKGGGVLVGKIQEDGIVVKLPGGSTYHFTLVNRAR